jgi:hypothetical protein
MNITQEGDYMNEVESDVERQEKKEAYNKIRHQVFIEELIQLAYNTPNDTILGLKIRSVLQKYKIYD